MTDRPAPLVHAEVDIRGFSGFMLDVDRLLASELVALASPEECWAAVMLWCRAWQQHPAGSLPNDERVLAAFSKAGPRWKKVREMALRGFILCSDGRLYHRVLAAQVMAAWAKRKAYRNDQERLRNWREKRKSDGEGNAKWNAEETSDETPTETDVKRVSSGVSEPDRQGQGQGQGDKDSSLRSPRAREADDPAFAAFWTAYPRKDDKGHARKAWNSAVRKASPATIMTGLARATFADDRRFQPLPATWLNGERWADQPPSLLPEKPPPVSDPDEFFGLGAWIARQQTEAATFKGKPVRAINGYAVEVLGEEIVQVIAEADGTVALRLNWDALAAWCRDDVLEDEAAWKAAVRRVTASITGPVRSLALFDGAIRDAARRAA